MDDLRGEYEQWVRPIEQRMMSAVWRIVRDPDEADDAFQQALEKVWRQWKRVREHPNPRALVMTICVHAAYDRLRLRSRHAAFEVHDEELESRPSGEVSALRQAAGRQAKAMIHDAIGKLPAMQRSTVSLRLLDGLSYDAIAQALGCSEATARTHFMRALKKLRSQLAQLNPDAREEMPS